MAEALAPVLRLNGEVRRAVLEGGRLVAMDVRRAGDGVGPGEVWRGRVLRAGWALAGGQEVRLAGGGALPEGAAVAIEVTRAAIPERGRLKPAAGRLVEDAPDGDGLLRPAAAWRGAAWNEDVAEQWDAAWAAAELGRVAFPGGALVLTPTPAHLAVDVDGERAGTELAVAAVRELARVLRLYGVGGSVVVDLPALPDKAARAAVGEAFDAAMAGSFERTAVNGYGLMQVVLPRDRPSVIERAWYQKAATAALALLAAAERDVGTGPVRLVLEPAAAAWLEGKPALVAECARRIGRPVAVRAVAGVGGGHVESA